MTEKQTPWIALKEVCDQYGYCYEVAKRKVREGKFPVPTYLVGRTPVIDREVHDAYFRQQREVALLALNSTKS